MKKINLVYIAFILLISLNLFSCNTVNNNFKSFTDDDEITTITKDSEKEFLEALEILNNKGGTIYIDTPVINMIEKQSIQLLGEISGGIIGVRQKNGEYPRISFSHKIETKEPLCGLHVYASNKFIEYIIVENSKHYGVDVYGDNNILDHVISRYNYGSGIAIFGNFNKINYCYSYRNVETTSSFIYSDGFLSAGELNNVFNYCFAWDNGNSGFHYIRLTNTSDLSYLHSAAWNNGNINVFTGKYDYDNGKPLDKNLWTIQKIIESDENFASNYYNKKFSIENAKIDQDPVKNWVSAMTIRADGDGFTFGFKNSTQNIDVKRNSFFNVAFGHKSGGFIDNFNHRYNAFVTDCVSFNNGINYKFPYYTLSKWSNNWSWNTKNKDQLNKGASLKKPKNINTAQRSFYTIRDEIIRAVTENMFPDGVNFDKAINSLKE